MGTLLLQQLRERDKAEGLTQVPAIAMTANARDEDRLKATKAGFSLHLPKPLWA